MIVTRSSITGRTCYLYILSESVLYISIYFQFLIICFCSGSAPVTDFWFSFPPVKNPTRCDTIKYRLRNKLFKFLLLATRPFSRRFRTGYITYILHYFIMCVQKTLPVTGDAYITFEDSRRNSIGCWRHDQRLRKYRTINKEALKEFSCREMQYTVYCIPSLLPTFTLCNYLLIPVPVPVPVLERHEAQLWAIVDLRQTLVYTILSFEILCVAIFIRNVSLKVYNFYSCISALR